MIRWIAILALSVLVAVGGVVVTLEATTPRPGPPPVTTGSVEHGEMQWEGRTRTWILYAPERASRPVPLVVGLPGSGQTGQHLRESMNYRFEALADRHGFLVVYAEAWAEGGRGGPEWNECRKNTDQPAHRENVDDVGFVMAVLDRVASGHEVDPDRVYAFGVSDGGQMAYRLATERPDRFAAIAAIVAQQAAPENSNCLEPRGPVSVLVMNGTADPIIPYQGGEASFFGWFSAGQVQSIEGTAAHWRRVNAIDGPSTREELPDLDADDASRVVRERWRAATLHEVVVYSIVGGGHTIPGGYLLPEALLGPTNRDIVAADEIWGFFERNPRR
jgi:polyhydroxybutyrate depolymerase